ncbi:hypothetical protein [Actinomyces culturomici]|uniref:hypothetical protein n=1 Tax=Actinomyces culturomici TaxID=1926276 RepID=UPI000E1FFE38|nr:hypothetical protein [Actinomyces culturomici]
MDAAEPLVIWTGLLREQERVVRSAYSNLARVWLDPVRDLGPSTAAARTVVDSVSDGVASVALRIDEVSDSMIASARSFEDLEQEIEAGFVDALAALNA